MRVLQRLGRTAEPGVLARTARQLSSDPAIRALTGGRPRVQHGRPPLGRPTHDLLRHECPGTFRSGAKEGAPTPVAAHRAPAMRARSANVSRMPRILCPPKILLLPSRSALIRPRLTNAADQTPTSLGDRLTVGPQTLTLVV